MRRVGKLATMLAVFFLLLMAPPVKSAIIWSDGFEDHSFAGWSGSDLEWTLLNSPQGVHFGSWGANIAGPTLSPDGSSLWRDISTAGYQDLHLSYCYKVRENLEAADYVAVEWLGDTGWQVLANYSAMAAGDWQFADLVLPVEAADNPNFGLRFRAVLGSASDRIGLDDVALTGEVPEPATWILILLASGLSRKRAA